MSEWYTKRCFGDLPEEAAQRWGEREALYFQGQRWSYRDLADEVDRAARALLALGVVPGEKVGLWLPNRPEWVFLMFALARAGAVQIPINTRLRSHELRYILEQSGTTSLISCERSGPANLLAVAREVLPGIETQSPESLSYPDLPAFRRFVAVGDCQHAGVLRWDELLARAGDIGDAALAERAAGVDPDDPLFIMYTSGTTGFPKGVVHNHNIIRNVEDRANRMAVTQDDVILTSLPLFHAFAYSEGAVSSVITGARQVLTETFDAEECLDLIAQEGVSLTFGFDTHFADLLEAQEREARDTHSLRTALLAAGMQSSTPIARRANEVFCPTITGYGMTECYVGVSLSFPTSNLSQRIESSGYPAPGYEIRVVDPETGRDRPADVQGEIWVRGYGVMEEYYEQPEETAKAIDSEGWLHTGDTGILRQDGYLRFLGRYKDMLKVGGENVDPMEVEGFLLEHPAIRQVAVVGYPDARLSEVPVAFVEPTASSSLTPEEVIAHCKGRIAGFKVPRHVLLVKEFPMTATGKIQKVVLREQALQQIPQTPRA